MKAAYNNRVNSGCQKRRGFRCATTTPLLAAGYAKRYSERTHDMKRTTMPTARLFVAAAIVLTTIFLSLSHAGDAQQPYYGFFPSEKGQNHKRFVHNIFGFSIDIPSTWVFGVNEVPPTAVVFLYPEGLNTGKVSKGYETIEIGQFPFAGMTLKEAQQTVMQGMGAKHPIFTIVQKPKKTTLNGMSAISWIYQWPSKTGYTVVEYITLVQSSSGTRSLAVRTTRRDYASRLSFYDGILKTFHPFKPKY
jgi:hypothetical protein